MSRVCDILYRRNQWQFYPTDITTAADGLATQGAMVLANIVLT